MQYKVIARKWRPQQFDDVVGQKTITRTLQNAIQQNRIAHAYLFTGTRGVGKTSTARILAKALNCAQGPTARPCDQCDSCTEIMQGNSVDVLEIDAASNRGIGEIRELRENVQYAPSRDRYKIFIIDEVHMLTMEAFNALLKTLEEPPGHVIFILATTELYKIPQTIVSRCQQFDFRIVPFDEIFQRLKRILQAEQMEVSDQALHFVVKASGGSMRDAESALQKIVSLGGEGVSNEDVASLLGVIHQDFLNRMMKAVLEQERPAIVELIDQLYERGHDLQNFLRSFMEFVRHVAIYQITQSEYHLVSLSKDDIGFIREVADKMQLEDCIRYYDLLLRSDSELRWTPFVRFHVEMAFLKLAALPHLASLEEIVLALQELPSAPPGEEMPPPPRIEAVPAVQQPATATAAPRPAPEPSAPVSTADRDKLRLLREEIGKKIAPLQPFLARLEFRLSGNTLQIVVPENSFFEKTLRQPNTQQQLCDVYKSLFNAVPEIVIQPKPVEAAMSGEAEKKKLADEQKRIEALFMDDPVARILIDKVSGKWIFRKQS
jgi:DNA polymerase-3 subunit gamma/tau